MNDNVHHVMKEFLNSVFSKELNPKPRPANIDCTCAMSGKHVPPEDLGGCNNAEGCDNCVHND